MTQNGLSVQSTLNVVGILPNQEVVYGKQVVTEDEDGGVILWDVGSNLPNDYFPIVEENVYFAHEDASNTLLAA